MSRKVKGGTKGFFVCCDDLAGDQYVSIIRDVLQSMGIESTYSSIDGIVGSIQFLDDLNSFQSFFCLLTNNSSLVHNKIVEQKLDWLTRSVFKRISALDIPAFIFILGKEAPLSKQLASFREQVRLSGRRNISIAIFKNTSELKKHIRSILRSHFTQNETLDSEATLHVESIPSPSQLLEDSSIHSVPEVEPEAVAKAEPAQEQPSFFGRQAELGTLDDWAIYSDEKIMFIHGAGGFGKSFLVKKWIEAIVEDNLAGWQNDFLFNCPNRSLDPNEFVSALSKLDIKLHDISQVWEKALETLSKRRYLIIIDNADEMVEMGYQKGFDGILEFAETLVEMGANKVVVTTRQSPVHRSIQSSVGYSTVELSGLRPREMQMHLNDLGVRVDRSSAQRLLLAQIEGNPATGSLLAKIIQRTATNFDAEDYLDVWFRSSPIANQLKDLDTLVGRRNYLLQVAIDTSCVPEWLDDNTALSYLAEVDYATEDLPPLELPVELIEACNRDDCIAFIGSGFAARAQIPTWVNFVRGLVSEAQRQNIITRVNANRQLAAIEQGEANAVADNIVSAYGDDSDALLNYYKMANTPSAGLPEVYKVLRKIPFAAILTSNYDNLLTETYRHTNFQCDLTPMDADTLLEFHSNKKPPYVLKLYGDLDNKESMIFAPTEYLNLVRSNAGFARYMEALFFTRTLLFVGASLEGISDYLAAFTFPSGVPQRHFALVAVDGIGWEAKAETLARRYNITVLPFRNDKSYSQVDGFLESLAKETRDSPNRADLATLGLPRLRKLVLENIGPFPRLELDFEAKWKILLGDNGVGKSTILRAIAIGMIGSEVKDEEIANLLRVGQSRGTILLQTLENPNGYQTEIQRVSGKPTISRAHGRPLESEGFLAIGFPPLRTTTAILSQGPQGPITKHPSANDLMPIVRSTPDTRMDDLKQWIINTDYIKNRSQSSGDIELSLRSAQILDDFFRIVSELTDQAIEGLDGISNEFRVNIRTKDGIVPIEAVSQGMTSLLSWVGIVLQRLYEVSYDDADIKDPTQSFFLIVMDEIDAHMHPIWQGSLVGKLKRIFPNAQFIASTHSPLVVGGLEIFEIARFVRNEKREVERKHVDDDMAIGRTDQILTGDLFGLNSTLALDEKTQKEMDEYLGLLSQSNRTDQDRQRFHFLHNTLIDRIPPSPETKLERRAYNLVISILKSEFNVENLPRLKDDLINNALSVMKSMGWESGDEGD